MCVCVSECVGVCVKERERVCVCARARPFVTPDIFKFQTTEKTLQLTGGGGVFPRLRRFWENVLPFISYLRLFFFLKWRLARPH